MDNLTRDQRKKTMRAVHSENTAPEMFVRRFVHSKGFRYRLHQKELPGKPDLVFARHRKVIFVNGCFWHGHSCNAGKKKPQSNSEYWSRKIARNKERDKKNLSELERLGWNHLTIWECEINSSPDRTRKKILRFLS